MSEVSPGLRDFLQQRLASIDQIQVVLLLRKDRTRSWTALEVAKELGTAPESAAMRLFLLASGGLLAFEAASIPRYRYGTVDAETDALLEELAQLVAADPQAVLSAVDSRPSDPLQSFADAFRLKK